MFPLYTSNAQLYLFIVVSQIRLDRAFAPAAEGRWGSGYATLDRTLEAAVPNHWVGGPVA